VALNATKLVKKKIDKKNIKCFNCNQKGHFESACPKIKREEAKNGTQGNGDEDSYVALHSDIVTGQSATWIIDSGASNHMTWDIRMFIKLQHPRSTEKSCHSECSNKFNNPR